MKTAIHLIIPAILFTFSVEACSSGKSDRPLADTIDSASSVTLDSIDSASTDSPATNNSN